MIFQIAHAQNHRNGRTMNLLDVITVTKPKAVKAHPDVSAKLIKSTESNRVALDLIKSFWGYNRSFPAHLNETGKMLAEAHNSLMLSEMRKHFEDRGSLPSDVPYMIAKPNRAYSSYRDAPYEMAESDDTLARMDKTPRAMKSSLMEISAQAKMTVMPFEYLNPKSYSNESRDMKRSIEKFNAAAPEVGMQVAVIAPLRHYSILHHIKAKDPNGSIIGNDYQQHFDMMSMIMPMLLMVSDRLDFLELSTDDLRKRMDAMDAQMKQVARSIESMQVQLKRLEDRVSELQRQQAEQRIAEIKGQQEAESIRSEVSRSSSYDSWFRIYEPLMFAYPKNKDLTSAEDFPCFIGPCWGPDFDDILAAVLDVKKVSGQRNRLSSALSNNWSS